MWICVRIMPRVCSTSEVSHATVKKDSLEYSAKKEVQELVIENGAFSVALFLSQEGRYTISNTMERHNCFPLHHFGETLS